MLNSYKKLFVVLAVLIAPLMFVAACDNSAPPRPMDTPAPPEPPSDDTSLGNVLDVANAIFPGAVDSFIGLTDADESLLMPIVAGTPITVETLGAFDNDLVDAVLDLDASGLDMLFTNINDVATGPADAGINSEVAMIQTVINSGLNDLFVYGQADGDAVFLGSNNDDVVALIDSLEITNEPGSSSVESISFTAPCDVTAISLPENVLDPAAGATAEVTLDGVIVAPANEQYLFTLAAAGMPTTASVSVTAEDGVTMRTLTITTTTAAASDCE